MSKVFDLGENDWVHWPELSSNSEIYYSQWTEMGNWTVLFKCKELKSWFNHLSNGPRAEKYWFKSSTEMNSYVTNFFSSNIDLNLSSMPEDLKVLLNSVFTLQRSDNKRIFFKWMIFEFKCESPKHVSAFSLCLGLLS